MPALRLRTDWRAVPPLWLQAAPLLRMPGHVARPLLAPDLA